MDVKLRQEAFAPRQSGRGNYVFGAAAAATIVLAVAQAAGASVIHIRVADLAFGPAHIAAHVGDTIEWANDDFVAHTATAKDHAFDISLPPHATARLVLKAPGSFAYYCRFHPGMTGVITVTK